MNEDWNENIPMQSIINNIVDWGAARGLHTPDMRGQFIKVVEEVGEIAAGIARKDPARIIDGVGDALVTLINTGACFAQEAYPDDLEEQRRCSQYFLSMCLYTAWKVIQNRTGKTDNGIFIKDE